MVTVGLPDAITCRIAHQDSSPDEPESANERKYETDDVNTKGFLPHFHATRFQGKPLANSLVGKVSAGTVSHISSTPLYLA